MLSDEDGMFDYCEAERELASGMTNVELAQRMIESVLSDVSAAETEFASTDVHAAEYRMNRAVVREAAFRLAGVREYEAELFQEAQTNATSKT